MSLRIVNRVNKSLNYTLPAPCGGLNVRDSLDKMAESEAIVMDNYFPGDTKLSLRKGYTSYVKTGTAFATLAVYKKYGTEKFIGISDGKAYNLTSAKKVSVFENVNFTQDACQTVQYKNHLYFLNGYDTPKEFYVDDDGVEHFADWNFEADGLTAETIVTGAVSKQFLWFVEKGSLKVWYAAEAGNVAGELYCFDLEQVVRYGGYLQAVCCWTVDGGAGMDDLTVFLTSEGEALVYGGSNPNSADDWSLKGSYKIPKPLGYRCVVSYQGDAVIVTEDGYVPLSKVLPLNQAGVSAVSFSDKIRGLVLERTAANRNKSGWQGIIYPRGGYALFNVPNGRLFEQHVINLNTGAWCRFTNVKARCWVLFGERLYFGGDYGVYRFDDGYSDDGNYICGEVRQAYNNFGVDKLKKIQLLNPRTKASVAYALVIYTDMDFAENNLNYAENVGQSGVTRWNEVKWSSLSNQIGTKWQTLQGRIRSQWVANSATGVKASVVFKTKTRGNLIEWFDTGVRYEVANGIL
jgi:hypothetical protein